MSSFAQRFNYPRVAHAFHPTGSFTMLVVCTALVSSACRADRAKTAVECNEPGYKTNENGICVDVDECLISTVCSSTAICMNTPGAYRCTCPNGYVDVNGDASLCVMEVSPTSATIVFPPQSSISYDDEITVTGRVSSTQEIVGVTVSGHEAESTDGFATWRASVPLTRGSNRLSVDVTTANSIVMADLTNATVTYEGTLWDHPQDLAIDSRAGVAYVLDAARVGLLKIDLTTGYRSIVSSWRQGVGPRLGATASAMALNEARDTIYVLGGTALYEVDIATGDRRFVAITESGSQLGLALANGAAYVADWDRRRLISIDLDTGDTTLISDVRTGTGPTFVKPRDVAVHGSTAYVLDSRGVFAVDVHTGDRRIISGESVGSGPHIRANGGLAVNAAANTLYVTDTAGLALFAVDIATGDRTVVVESGVAPENTFVSPQSITFEPTSDHSLHP